MEKQRITEGMRVKWMDPEVKEYGTPEDIYWAINRIFIVDKIDGKPEEDNDRLVHISEENGYSSAEVWEHELIAISL